MKNRKADTTEKIRNCFGHKSSNAKIIESRTTTRPRVRKNGPNALIRLMATYPSSSEESSAEMSDHNVDADRKCDRKWNQTFVDDVQDGTNKELDQRKGENQLRQNEEKTETNKQHIYAVGELLSKLRSKDTPQSAKYNISEKPFRGKTKSTFGPPNGQEQSKDIHFLQHEGKSDSQLLDGQHLKNDGKKDCVKKSDKREIELYVTETGSRSVVVQNEKCTGKNIPQQEVTLVDVGDGESLSSVRHTDKKCKRVVKNAADDGKILMTDSMCLHRVEEVTPLISDVSSTVPVMGQVGPSQPDNLEHGVKDVHMKVDVAVTTVSVDEEMSTLLQGCRNEKIDNKQLQDENTETVIKFCLGVPCDDEEQMTTKEANDLNVDTKALTGSCYNPLKEVQDHMALEKLTSDKYQNHFLGDSTNVSNDQSCIDGALLESRRYPTEEEQEQKEESGHDESLPESRINLTKSHQKVSFPQSFHSCHDGDSLLPDKHLQSLTEPTHPTQDSLQTIDQMHHDIPVVDGHVESEKQNKGRVKGSITLMNMTSEYPDDNGAFYSSLSEQVVTNLIPNKIADSSLNLSCNNHQEEQLLCDSEEHFNLKIQDDSGVEVHHNGDASVVSVISDNVKALENFDRIRLDIKPSSIELSQAINLSNAASILEAKQTTGNGQPKEHFSRHDGGSQPDGIVIISPGLFRKSDNFEMSRDHEDEISMHPNQQDASTTNDQRDDLGNHSGAPAVHSSKMRSSGNSYLSSNDCDKLGKGIATESPKNTISNSFAKITDTDTGDLSLQSTGSRVKAKGPSVVDQPSPYQPSPYQPSPYQNDCITDIQPERDVNTSQDPFIMKQSSESLEHNLLSLSYSAQDGLPCEAEASLTPSSKFIFPGNLDCSSPNNNDNMTQQLATKSTKDERRNPIKDTIDVESADLTFLSFRNISTTEPKGGIQYQETDLHVHSSMIGLSDTLEKKFASKSCRPIPMRGGNMKKDLDVILSSVGCADCDVNMTPVIDASLLNSHGVEQEVTQQVDCFMEIQNSAGVSRSVTPSSDDSGKAKSELHNDQLKGEESVVNECLNSQGGRDEDNNENGIEIQQTCTEESNMIKSCGTDQNQESNSKEDTLKEAPLSEALEEHLSMSDISKEFADDFNYYDCHEDDALSLVCDTEDLMENLDDLLQEENGQKHKQSPKGDDSKSICDRLPSKSTSTKDSDDTKHNKQTRESPSEIQQSPIRSRNSARTKERSTKEEKQGFKISINSRNENSRYVCKNQESGMALIVRSPKRLPGHSRSPRRVPDFNRCPRRVTVSDRDRSFKKPFSASLHQRLGDQTGTSASPNLALQRLIRNGPFILQQQQHHQQQLQQQLQLQQQFQRQLLQLPPALQLRLGVVQNTALTPSQSTPDEVAIICQRQRVMMEKIIQLYQKQKESDDVVEKQRDVIRHYQRAFLIAKKGGPISMQEVSLRSNGHSSPRPNQPSPESDRNRRIGRKWPLPYDQRNEQRSMEHLESKRIRYSDNMETEDHLGEQSEGYPDSDQPQRPVERRIVKLRGNHDRAGPDYNEPQSRDPENCRFQRGARMLISIPSDHSDEEQLQEKRCIRQRKTPVFSGSRYHPHPNFDDEELQPDQNNDEYNRAENHRLTFVETDVHRQPRSGRFDEEVERNNLHWRNPHISEEGVVSGRASEAPSPGYMSSQECAGPVMSSQGRRSPSPDQRNWKSCRITRQVPRSGMVTDYNHKSFGHGIQQDEREEKQEAQEHPVSKDQRIGWYSPPKDAYVQDPRTLHSDYIGEAPFTSHVHHEGTCSQRHFKDPNHVRQRMHPFNDDRDAYRFANNQDSYKSSVIHHLVDRSQVHRMSPNPSVENVQPFRRAPRHYIVDNVQTTPREPQHPVVGYRRGTRNTSADAVEPAPQAGHPFVDDQGFHRSFRQLSGGIAQAFYREPRKPVIPYQAPPRPSRYPPGIVPVFQRAPFHPSVVAISHHYVAQNFAGHPRILPNSRISATPGPGLLNRPMRTRMEYRQESCYQASEQVDDRRREWIDGYYG